MRTLMIRIDKLDDGRWKPSATVGSVDMTIGPEATPELAAAAMLEYMRVETERIGSKPHSETIGSERIIYAELEEVFV